jgi:cytochrome c oxidase assembly protein subunit 15
MLATVLVGGAARLTEFGLDRRMEAGHGVVRRSTRTCVAGEFDQTIPQYRERNPKMTLDEFKTIYWWEWSHRLLARLVGAAFLLPFLWFLWGGAIEPPLRARLMNRWMRSSAAGCTRSSRRRRCSTAP